MSPIAKSSQRSATDKEAALTAYLERWRDAHLPRFRAEWAKIQADNPGSRWFDHPMNSSARLGTELARVAVLASAAYDAGELHRLVVEAT